jgi:hypothetical protein
LEYQAEYARAQKFHDASMVEAIENLALRLMSYQAELEKGEQE